MNTKENYVTPYFKWSEFACKNGEAVPEHLRHNVRMLAGTLEALRLHFREPIVINSAYRTPAYNKSVGGAVNSYHLQAKAVDIRVKNVSPAVVHDTIANLMLLKLVPPGAVILYPTFVHYDQRGTIMKLYSSKQ